MVKSAARDSSRAGMTLVEILIVIALMVALSAVGLINLLSRRGKTEVDSTARQMVGLLRQAQSYSMSQASSTSWGVRFWNTTSTAPFYAIFAGSEYSVAGEAGHYRLPERVFYATSTISSGASKDVIFSQITGAPSASTTIGIISGDGQISSTISIYLSGLISF